MKLIVAVDKHWAIGCRGRLLADIPADKKFFRNETTGKVVVMGRKTLESLPGGMPLPNRRNVVLSRNPGCSVKGADVCHSVEEVFELLKDCDPDDIYIIGGESIYRQFLPYCTTAYVTWIDYAYDADTSFPNLDALDEWELEAEGEEQTYFNLIYEFRRYRRTEKQR